MSAKGRPRPGKGRKYTLPALDQGSVLAGVLLVDAAKSGVLIEQYKPVEHKTVPLTIGLMFFQVVEYESGYNAGQQVPEGETVGVILDPPFLPK